MSISTINNRRDKGDGLIRQRVMADMNIGMLWVRS